MMNNNKGFTLIESIITFAILTVVGIMFMFAFSNVSTLMVEGSMIKDKTNDLYEELLKETRPKEDGDKIITINFKDRSSIIQYGVTDQFKKGTAKEGIDIRLTRFVTNQDEDVAWLPDGPGGDVIDNPRNYNASFVILKDLQDFPKNYQSMKKDTWLYTNSIYLEYALSNDTPENIFDLNGVVDKYLIKRPIIDETTTNINDVKYLSSVSNYDVFWYAINNTAFPTVYGVLIPKNEKCIIFVTEQYNAKITVLKKTNGLYSIDNTELPQNDMGNSYYIDGKLYS